MRGVALLVLAAIPERGGRLVRMVGARGIAPPELSDLTASSWSTARRLASRWCPNHEVARRLLAEVIESVAPGTLVDDVDASDPAIAAAHHFPGSPTIRVDGRDIDPRFRDPGDYTPRCRVFWTADGLRGVPPREWIEDALYRVLTKA